MRLTNLKCLSAIVIALILFLSFNPSTNIILVSDAYAAGSYKKKQTVKAPKKKTVKKTAKKKQPKKKGVSSVAQNKKKASKQKTSTKKSSAKKNTAKSKPNNQKGVSSLAQNKNKAYEAFNRNAPIPYAGGKKRVFTTKKTEVYYRVYSGANSKGAWLTKVPPKSSAYAKQALNLPAENKANKIQKVIVPKGVILERSRAKGGGPHGKQGGAEQFRILPGQVNKGIKFEKGVPLN